MRHKLSYPPDNFTEDDLKVWKGILASAQCLPPREQYFGRERLFANWLKKEYALKIKKQTEDELSAYLSAPPRNMVQLAPRSPSEALIYSILTEQNKVLSQNLLENWAAKSLGTDQEKIRTTRLFSEKDNNGRTQEFIPPEEVPFAVAEICRVWNEVDSTQETFPRPIWVLVALLNAHAFRDGNGRLARSLFNVLLIQSGNLQHGPVPWAPLIFATQGNFELATGRAAIAGTWRPILNVIQTLVNIYSDLLPEFEFENANTLWCKARV